MVPVEVDHKCLHFNYLKLCPEHTALNSPGSKKKEHSITL